MSRPNGRSEIGHTSAVNVAVHLFGYQRQRVVPARVALRGHEEIVGARTIVAIAPKPDREREHVDDATFALGDVARDLGGVVGPSGYEAHERTIKQKSPGATPGGRAGVLGLTSGQEGGSLPLRHSRLQFGERVVPSTEATTPQPQRGSE